MSETTHRSVSDAAFSVVRSGQRDHCRRSKIQVHKPRGRGTSRPLAGFSRRRNVSRSVEDGSTNRASIAHTVTPKYSTTPGHENHQSTRSSWKVTPPLFDRAVRSMPRENKDDTYGRDAANVENLSARSQPRRMPALRIGSFASPRPVHCALSPNSPHVGEVDVDDSWPDDDLRDSHHALP